MPPRASAASLPVAPDGRAIHAGPLAQRADEARLVERLRASDLSAFDAIFLAHYDALCECARWSVGSVDVAEEVVQEVLFDLWERRAALTIASSLRAYLFGAVRRRAIDHVRRLRGDHRLREAVAREVMAGVGAGPVPAAEADADSRLRAREIDAALAQAIARLPERCRAVYVLRWYQHLTYSEIAEVLGITVKTVEVHVATAHKLLRRRLRAFL